MVEQRSRGDAPIGQTAQGEPVFLRNGRYGWYLQQGSNDLPADQRKTASLSTGMDPAALSLDTALRQLALPRSMGRDPQSGTEVSAHVGRYGDYVQRGEERRNLPAGLLAIDVSLEEALALLARPRGGKGREHLRDVGVSAEGAQLAVWSGRFGLYVTDGTRTAPLKATVDPAQLTVADAIALLAAAEQARTGKVLGQDPQTGQDVRLLDGRFGPYLTNGSVNASLARGTDPSDMTLEAALDRLQHFGKPAKGGKSKKAAQRARTKPTTAKSASAKAASAQVAKKAAPGATKTAVKTTAKKTKTKPKAAAKPAAKASAGKAGAATPVQSAPPAARSEPANSRPTVVRRRPAAP
jgi:DNA topoisomerase-1